MANVQPGLNRGGALDVYAVEQCDKMPQGVIDSQQRVPEKSELPLRPFSKAVDQRGMETIRLEEKPPSLSETQRTEVSGIPMSICLHISKHVISIGDGYLHQLC